MLVTDHCCGHGPQMGIYFSFFAIKVRGWEKVRRATRRILGKCPQSQVWLCATSFRLTPLTIQTASTMQDFTWGTRVHEGRAEPSGRFQMLLP